MDSKSILVAIAGAAALSLATAVTADNDQMQEQAHDAWLDGKLEATLLFNPHLNSFDINTEVKEGVAYLTGVVESDIDRDLAGEIAESIEGISKVENDLDVDRDNAREPSESEAYAKRSEFRQNVTDATITASIKTQLLLNNNTGGLQIDVDTEDGIVTLTGEVGSDQERDLAVKIAENTEGTSEVIDRMVVEKA